MIRKLVAAFALAVLLTGPAASATVEVAPYGEDGGKTVFALAIAGPIQPGDDVKVSTVLDQALRDGEFPGFAILTSNGGDTAVSRAISKIFHDLGMPVLIRGGCYSACATIALSTRPDRLFVDKGGELGVHQAWRESDDGEAHPALGVSAEIANMLHDYGVSDEILVRLLRTAPGDISIISDDELRALGVHVRRH